MTGTRTKVMVGVLLGTLGAFGAGVAHAYRRDLDEARRRVEAVPKRFVSTRFGMVEYAQSGTGDPVLVSHGIFHGCDGGLLSVRDVIGGRKVIAPSRFGYLGSDFPPGATPEAQADAFAELLDHLGISSVDVIGISAGTTAALLFALRHPARTRHLVILSGNLPGDPTAAAPPTWAKLLYADLPMWTMEKVARQQVARMMGVPAGFPRDAAQGRVVDEMLESIFPVRPRVKGATFDAFVSNPAVNALPIEALGVPTLMVHSKDDPLCAYAAVEEASHRIPGCRLVAFETGGHLGLGQAEQTRAELDAFFNPPLAA